MFLNGTVGLSLEQEDLQHPRPRHLECYGGDKRPMRLTRGIVNRWMQHGWTEVVYYFSRFFPSVRASWRVVPVQLLIGAEPRIRAVSGASGSQNLALANTHSIGHQLAAYGDFSLVENDGSRPKESVCLPPSLPIDLV